MVMILMISVKQTIEITVVYVVAMAKDIGMRTGMETDLVMQIQQHQVVNNQQFLMNKEIR